MFDTDTILALDDKDGIDFDEAVDLDLLDDPSEKDRLIEDVESKED